MKRYIQLAKYYADYRKFCDRLDKLCSQNELLVKGEIPFDYAHEMLEQDVVYMLYNKPVLASLALDFKLDAFMLRKYPHSEGIGDALFNALHNRHQFYLDHVQPRD